MHKIKIMISSQIFLSIVILNQLASQLACRQIRSRGLAATVCKQLQLAIYLARYLGDCQQLSSCLTKPPDLLFLVVLSYSFYIISRHHLSQIFRTSASFNIIMKKRFLSQNSLLTDSLKPNHPLNDQNRLSMTKVFF